MLPETTVGLTADQERIEVAGRLGIHMAKVMPSCAGCEQTGIGEIRSAKCVPDHVECAIKGRGA